MKKIYTGVAIRCIILIVIGILLIITAHHMEKDKTLSFVLTNNCELTGKVLISDQNTIIRKYHCDKITKDNNN